MIICQAELAAAKKTGNGASPQAAALGQAAEVEDHDRRDIQASLNGDQDAYGRLVDRYQQAVANLMWRFTRKHDELEELVQDVFVQAYFSLKSYRGEAPWLHWLRRIGTRIGYRFWKARERRKSLVQLDDVSVYTTDPDNLDAEEAAEALDGLLARLKPADRLVLTLQYLEQCSVKEIAHRTGWTIAMVKMRAYRARNRLRHIARQSGLLEEI